MFKNNKLYTDTYPFGCSSGVDRFVSGPLLNLDEASFAVSTEGSATSRFEYSNRLLEMKGDSAETSFGVSIQLGPSTRNVDDFPQKWK